MPPCNHHLHGENRHLYPLIERCIPAAELDEMSAHLPLSSPAEGSPGFLLLYRQIADQGFTGGRPLKASGIRRGDRHPDRSGRS